MALEKIPAAGLEAGSVNATAIAVNSVPSSRLTTTGVVANSYGNSSQIPVITVDAAGRVTNASLTAVAGVTDFTYESGNNAFRIATGDGSSFAANLPYRSDQNLRTTDAVQFGNTTISGNLTVTGVVTTVNTVNLSVQDNMIYLNANSVVSNPDLGFVGNYNDGTYAHAGLFRDASDGTWKVFDGYLPEPDASPYIDTANASFHLANFQANVVYANVTGNVTGNVSGSANSATYVGGNTASDLNSYASTAAGAAYTNAVSQATTLAGTAYTNATSYAATIAGTAYSNAVSVAASDATTKAGTAYSNATSYADTVAGTAYTNSVSQATTLAGTAYSNAVSYAGTIAGTAYSNAVSVAASDATTKAGTAYTNAVSVATSLAGNAYSNAVAYADAKVANLVNSAPAALDTLFELASALGNDASFSTTVTTGIGNAYTNAVSQATTKAGTAYSNAVSYAATIAGTAYSNAVSTASSDATTKAGTAYSNAVSYAATIAGTAYSNAVAYAASNSYVNSTFLPLAGGTMTGGIANVATLAAGNTTVSGTVILTGTNSTAPSTADSSPSILNIRGASAKVRMQFGVQDNTPYGGWIQTSYDNGGGANGTEPLLLNPLGGLVTISSNSSMGYALGVNGSFATNDQARAPIYYDYDDTNYYVNPAGSTSVNVNGYIISQGTGGDKGALLGNLQVGYASYYNTVQTTSGSETAWIQYGHAGNVGLAYGGGYTTAYQSIRSPIFYDSDNTSYYANPAGTSVLGSIDLYSTTSLLFKGNGNSGTYNSTVLYTNYNNTSADNFNGIFIERGRLTDSGTAEVRNFVIGARGGQVQWKVDGDGVATATASYRAPIFYDSDDTGYYTNPAGSSYIKSLSVGGNIGTTTYPVYVESGQKYLVGLKNTAAANATNYWWLVHDDDLIFHRNGTADRFYFSGAGNGTAAASWRAPIFYDSDDSNYYANPAGTSSFSRTAVASVLSVGAKRSYNLGNLAANGTQARRYEIARLYIDYNDWHGAGVFQVELHSSYFSGGDYQLWNISYDYNNIKCTLISGDSPRGRSAQVVCGSATQISGDYYYLPVYVDVQYYMQYYCFVHTSWPETVTHQADTGAVLVYSSPSGTNISDFTVSTLVSTTNSLQSESSVRAPIFYDSDDTGYYANPASTTKLSGLQVWHGSTSYYTSFANNNEINTYTSSASAATMYLNWNGGAVNISSNTLVADDGVVTASASHRAPIFYDSDDTNYYVNHGYNASGYGSTHRSGILIGPNETWGAYLLVGGNGKYSYGLNNTSIASVATTNGNLHLDAASGAATYINYYDGTECGFYAGDSTGSYVFKVLGSSGYSIGTGSIRAPIFYDSDDTGYYANPASTSRFTGLIVGSHGGTAYNTASSGRLYFGVSNDNSYSIYTHMEDYGGNYTKLTLDWHTGIKIGAYYGYGGIRFFNDAINNGSGTEVFSVAKGDSNVRVVNNLYASSVYDNDDTNYYLNPNSGSRLANIFAGDVASTNDGSWNARLNLVGSYHARLDVVSNSDGIITTMYSHTGQGVGRVGTSSNHPLVLMAQNSTAGGYVYAGSLRAAIFYDNDDTNYFLNAAGQSILHSAICYSQWFFRSNMDTTSSSPALQAYSDNGSGAIMSFHRASQYAVNMGLDSDNVFRIGGWSASANRLQMDMSGNLTMAGNVTAYSDIRLKDNIELITSAIDKVKQIRGVTFTRNDQEDNTKRHAGVIAQEVEAVLPEVVSEDNSGMKNVAYGNMVGLLVEAIKEQQSTIERLEALVNSLINKTGE